jgi:hypothetical protein
MLLSNDIVATTKANHIVSTITLDTTVAFDAIVAFLIPSVALLMSRHVMRRENSFGISVQPKSTPFQSTQVFFTLQRKRRTPYGRVHFCLCVVSFSRALLPSVGGLKNYMLLTRELLSGFSSNLVRCLYH